MHSLHSQHTACLKPHFALPLAHCTYLVCWFPFCLHLTSLIKFCYKLFNTCYTGFSLPPLVFVLNHRFALLLRSKSQSTHTNGSDEPNINYYYNNNGCSQQ